MRLPLFARHGALLFRSYLVLVVGLLLVAIVLDTGFRMLHESSAERQDPWLAASVELIDEALAGAGPGEHAALVQRLSRTTGLEIRLLPRDDVLRQGDGSAGLEALVDVEGRTSYLYPSSSFDGLILVRPIEAPPSNSLANLLTPVFYLSIFVIVGVWLRPLLRDIDHITTAARRFAADYRQPLATAAEATRLRNLASDLDDMSMRVSGLIQSQKELIAALSHEMRTPLARIRFALAVIDARGDSALGEQLEALSEDVQEIDLLIGTMLSYARLDHPDLRMNWQSVPVNAWLAESSVKWRQTDKKVAFSCDGELSNARMDAHLMGLALSNLLSNAVRHADQEVRCSIRHRDGDVAIIVEDDGCGVPADKRGAVFKAFTRLDGSRSRETGGAGLGLAIVARIAALHGGSIEVDSSATLGGARFTLRWPGVGASSEYGAERVPDRA